MERGRGARRDEQQPKCYQGSGFGLGESENLLVAQAKACETCLALMRTGFGCSCRGDIPSATLAGYWRRTRALKLGGATPFADCEEQLSQVAEAQDGNRN